MNIHPPRGTLARAIYAKFHNDFYLDKYDTRLVCILYLCNPYIFVIF